jgi:hypothetical protein
VMGDDGREKRGIPDTSRLQDRDTLDIRIPDRIGELALKSPQFHRAGRRSKPLRQTHVLLDPLGQRNPRRRAQS